ncbi:MAG: hypothetical protein C4589_02465 [Peptococcaceae bacterium]|nr:MAG: hypothetical protein C4589_02465 [Peptococcaceae bacterium]
MNLDALAKEVEENVRPVYRRIDETALKNQARVLASFRKAKVSDFHLKGSTGYGYGDEGRRVLEEVYAGVFRTESALVRSQIISGTHAIALCLYGILRPGDEILAVQGTPYDTLAGMIKSKTPGSLREFGIHYRQVELLPDGGIDWNGIKSALNNNTRMVFLQRSCGYRWRRPLTINQMREVIRFIKEIHPPVVVMVDNCYGEFVEAEEPTDAGADLVAGSLIKNPGGGLAPTGGYVVGQNRFVEMAASRWSAPGIAGELGPSPDFQRLFFQGLFIAPHVVSEALKGAVFVAQLFSCLGFAVLPAYDAVRTDLVQAIRLESPEMMIAFCRGLQKASPVNSFFNPEPGKVPGYEDPVIMAAGNFVQGASLELSADGPLRPPYVIYLQGGLSREHVKLAILSAAKEVLKIAK